MIVNKKFNNNVVLTKNYKGQEVVLMGKGLAFNVRPGDTIDESRIEKRFVIDQNGLSNTFTNFLNTIPGWALNMSHDIIEKASEDLGVKLSSYLYLALSDHIMFAIKRNKENIEISNPLLWEIKRIYAKEYHAALASLQIIKEHTGTALCEDEAGYIAFHFVNCQQGKISINDTMEITKIVKDILEIVQYHFSIQITEHNSFKSERFLIHLKFFAQRVIESLPFSEGNISIIDDIRKRWPKVADCVVKIQYYIKKNYDVTISEDEQFYLMIHIQRVIQI